MKTFSVKLVPLGKVIRAKAGTPLIDILHEYGVEFPCGGKGTCGKCRVKVIKGELKPDAYHRKRLHELGLNGGWRLACLSSCVSDLELEVGQYEHIIQADESSFEFIPRTGLGIAFDLGTTTLVGQLLDLSTGRVLAVETALNPQKVYGSDLITRLETALRDGPEEMTRIIRKKVGKMTRKLLGESPAPLHEMAIVGNTVMHHLFCGYDITPLSFYPFKSPHLKKTRFSSEELGWDRGLCDRVDFYPSIGSFVGSDILAGILATGMFRKEDYSVLIDLGTNGEIVAGNKNQLLCASTAAGPAFEGAKISQGMQAVTGAISSITGLEQGWKCQVIGNVKSRGICGSGLIDAVSILMEKDLIGVFGEIQSGAPEIALDPRVKLSQNDIQEFQLAKAAIAAGLEILLRKLGIGYNEVHEVYIAGGFGNYINLSHVTGVGMLPFPADRIRKLGNLALMGAKMFLFEEHKKCHDILGRTHHVSLEGEADFQDIFVNHLSFDASS